MFRWIYSAEGNSGKFNHKDFQAASFIYEKGCEGKRCEGMGREDEWLKSLHESSCFSPFIRKISSPESACLLLLIFLHDFNFLLLTEEGFKQNPNNKRKPKQQNLNINVQPKPNCRRTNPSVSVPTKERKQYLLHLITNSLFDSCSRAQWTSPLTSPSSWLYKR